MLTGTKSVLLLPTWADCLLIQFGMRYAELGVPFIRAAGGKSSLIEISYNDRFLQTPLVVRLLADALGALRAQLDAWVDPVPVQIVTGPLKPSERQLFTPDHDWQWPETRNDVLKGLLEARGMAPTLAEDGALHGRVLTLNFAGGKVVRVILDQGFGPWRALCQSALRVRQ